MIDLQQWIWYLEDDVIRNSFRERLIWNGASLINGIVHMNEYIVIWLQIWVDQVSIIQCIGKSGQGIGHSPGGHWPRKGVWGCAALKTPFSRLSSARKGPISSKRVSSQDPLLRKFGNFSLISLNFHPNFSSQAPKFGNFQLTSPQIWKFSSHKPPFSEANVSSQAPQFGNPGRTPLPEKKSSAPPGALPLMAKGGGGPYGPLLWIFFDQTWYISRLL